MLTSASVRYFIEVATRGSISAAAESLLIAPSAVSRQVQLLEKELGVGLFERSSAGMVLTGAGVEALEHFTAAADRDEALRERLRGGASAAVAVLRTGLLEGLVSLVPSLTARLDRWSPGTRLDVKVLPSRRVEESVIDGEVDFGFASGRDVCKELRVVATQVLPVHVVVGPGHRLAGRNSVSLEELADLPVVLPDVTFGIRQEVDRACREHRIIVDLVGEANSLTSALELALADRAATLLTLAVLPPDADRRGISAIPVKDKRLASVPISVVVGHEPRRASAAQLGTRLGRALLNGRAVRAWT